MRLLVCGGRDFSDAALLDRTILTFTEKYPLTCIIEGGARGADKLARSWAERHGVAVIEVPALWGFFGKKAGNLRNEKMLELCWPNYVIAFPGGRGTADMIRRSKEAGLTVWEVTP